MAGGQNVRIRRSQLNLWRPNFLRAYKFSRKDDELDVIGWEAVALTLASSAGILVPEWRLAPVGRQRILVSRRFDRRKNTRIPFLSSMSILSTKDDERHSYLEIADAIQQISAEPKKDLEELWRRIVFNVLISNGSSGFLMGAFHIFLILSSYDFLLVSTNTNSKIVTAWNQKPCKNRSITIRKIRSNVDDHLRNHSFLYLSPSGWSLSPAYDLNPTPTDSKPRILSTAIDLVDPRASLDLALNVAHYFGLDTLQAQKIAQEVGSATASWRQEASKLKIKKTEIDRMASAFEREFRVFGLRFRHLFYCE